VSSEFVKFKTICPLAFGGLSTENKSNSTTCNIAYILDVFSLCFTKCKVKKYRQKQNERKTRAKKKRENKLRVAFVYFV